MGGAPGVGRERGGEHAGEGGEQGSVRNSMVRARGRRKDATHARTDSKLTLKKGAHSWECVLSCEQDVFACTKLRETLPSVF